MKLTKEERFRDLLAREGLAVRTEPAIPRRPGPREGEASFAQRRIWVNQMLDPRSTVYNILLAVRLDGRLSEAAAAQAFAAIVERHEALRTTFSVVRGTPHQVVHASVPSMLQHADLAIDDASTGGSTDATTGVRADAGPADLEARLADALAARQQKPFALDRAPLCEATLLRLADDVHVLAIALHHIVFDVVSSQVLLDEFGQLYEHYARGRPCTLPERRVQYLDYADWQRARLAEPASAATLDAWTRALGTNDDLAIVELPGDRPFTPEAAFEPARETFVIPPDTVSRLRALSRDAGVSAFCIGLAAFQILLERYADLPEVLCCVPHAEREDPDLEGAIGFFVNLVIVRLRVRRQASFRTLLRETHEEYLDAIGPRSYPFDKLVEALAPHRHQGVTRLGDLGFAYQRSLHAWRDLGGLRATFLDANVPIAKSDLWLSVYEEADRCRGYIEYNGARFTSGMMRALGEHYGALLAALLAQPDRAIGTLVPETPASVGARGGFASIAAAAAAAAAAPAPAGRITQAGAGVAGAAIASNAASAELSTSRGPDSPTTLPEILETQARRTPHAIALAMDGTDITYRALNRRANQLARALQEHGVARGEAVGLLLPRRLDAYVALLAILKAGAIYVPMDRAHPAAHLLAMVATADVRHIIVDDGMEPLAMALDGSGTQVLPLIELRDEAQEKPAADGVSVIAGEQIAYVCFTSGSQGDSKGVFVQHRPAAAHVQTFARAVPIAQDDRVLQFASLTFDVSIEQMFSAWSAGATLCPRGDEVWSVRELAERIASDALSAVNLPTAYWNQLARLGAAADLRLAGGPLRTLVAGGEAMLADAARHWSRIAGPDVRLVNAYGPTETVITATLSRVESPDTLPAGVGVPIGWALPGRQGGVLDRHGMPVPAGAVGELCLAGGALAGGYLTNPRLTADRFVPAASALAAGVPGTRLYRTGDWVRVRPGEGYEFRHRKDDEIKIRGVRVVPALVESVALEHPSLVEAAAIVRESLPERGDAARAGHGGDRRSAVPAVKSLVLFYVSAPDAPNVPAEEIREFLAARVPDPMLPSEYIALDALPVTVSGKLDRRGLQQWRAAAGTAGRAAAAPASAEEQRMAAIWSQVLNLPAIAPEENFFQRGGHSLLATQVIMEIEQAFGVTVPLNVIFKYPTVRALTAHVASLPVAAPASAAASDAAAAAAASPEALVPLSHAQRRLWYSSQVSEHGLEYKIVKVLDLRGRLNLPALAQGLGALIARHETLRTCFGYVGGHLVQRVQPPGPPALDLVDLSALPDAARAEVYASIEAHVLDRPFDLEQGPLVRLTLVRYDAAHVRLIFDVHHIVIDGWSFGILVRELNAVARRFAEGRPGGLPELPAQYRDYARAEQARVDQATQDRQLAYWQDTLRDLPDLDLRPERGSGEPVSAGDEDGEIGFAIPPDVSARMTALCAAMNTTPFILLASIYHQLLAMQSGMRDLAIGTDLANRDSKAHAGLIGFFVNQLVLRVRSSDDLTFRELCQRMRATVEEAFAHKDLPYDAIVRARPAGPAAAARDSLFRAKFVFHQQLPDLAIDGIETRLVQVKAQMAKFDLLLNVEESPEGLSGSFEYRGTVLDAATVTDWIARFQALCDLVSRDADQPLPALAGAAAQAARVRAQDERDAARAGRQQALRQFLMSRHR